MSSSRFHITTPYDPCRTTRCNKLTLSSSSHMQRGSEDPQFWTRSAEAHLSALPDSLSVEQLQHELEDCKMALEHSVTELRRRIRRKNGRVGGLPVEVLALIFSWLSVMDPIGEVDVDALFDSSSDGEESDSDSQEEDDGYIETQEQEEEDEGDTESAWSRASSQLSEDPALEAYRYSLGWVLVTHVCHHWREVALSDPVLWSNIPMHIPLPWISTLIARSGTAPLNIEFTGEDKDDTILSPDSLGLPWLERARSIVYQHYWRNELPYFLNSFEAPILESLDTTSIFAASILESGSLPALRSLDVFMLDRLPNRLSGGISSQLTRLCIGSPLYIQIPHRGLTLHPTPFSFFKEFMQFISSLVRIEILELHGCLPRTTPAQSEDVEIVSCQKLRRVTFTGFAMDCAQFARHLVTPSHTSFHIDCFEDQCDGYRSLALDSLAPRTNFRTMAIALTCHNPDLAQCVLNGSDHAQSAQAERTTSNDRAFDSHDASFDADFTLSINPRVDGVRKPWIQGLPQELCMNFSLQNVQSLSLDFDGALNIWSTVHTEAELWHPSEDDTHVWDASRWADLLRPAMRLQHLRVFCSPSERVPECSTVVDLLQAVGTSDDLIPNIQLLDVIDLDPDFGLAAAFDAHIPDSATKMVKDPNSPDAHYFLHHLLLRRPALNVNLIRRRRRNYREKWLLRDSVATGELKGRIHFVNQAFIP
ncbi:unnamed protein product [Peniophora sp. CBMAI 1063]|nr:unnamed protein product [Peniophora sp. CBMAI 1063]